LKTYSVIDGALSPDFPLGDAVEASCVTRTPSASSRRVRGDAPELAAKLRIEERELDAGGLN
jgi:hypothetical protein